MIPAQTASQRQRSRTARHVTLPVELSAADRARVDAALRDSRAANTRAQYRSAWRGWAEWSALNMHATLPADPLAIAAYLAERVADGAAAATVRTIRAAIRAGHVDTGADDPTGHDGVRRVLQGLTRQAAGRGRGQADPLTADDVAAIIATASIPRRTGRGMESEAAAADRGAIDRAIVAVAVPGWLAQVGSGGASLGAMCRTRRTAAASWSASAGRKPIRTAPRRTCATSRTDAPLRFASCATGSPCSGQGCARMAPRQVLGGINGQSIARRLTAAARAAGIEGRITGHSGRVGLAVELTRRGAPEQATAKAGGWKSSRMVAHYAAAVAAEQGAVATYL